MKYIFFDKINKDIISIRTKVFVEEQGFKNEFDDIDKAAQHILCSIDKRPVAVGRIYKGSTKGECIIGRIAVLKEYRKLHLGSSIIKELEKKAIEMGARIISISAQTRVREFYEKQGYIACGDVYYDEFCPHIKMTKILEN